MKIFNFQLDVDKEAHASKAVVECNDEDFDPEALAMIKSLIEDVGKLIIIAYIKQNIDFTITKGGEA